MHKSTQTATFDIFSKSELQMQLYQTLQISDNGDTVLKISMLPLKFPEWGFLTPHLHFWTKIFWLNI